MLRDMLNRARFWGPVVWGLCMACGPETSGATETTTGVVTTEAVDPGTTGFELPPVSCSDDPTGAASGMPDALCPDHEATNACCCFEDVGQQGMSSMGTASVCGVQALCPVIQLVCPGTAADCELSLLTVENPAEIDCALQALAAGATGRIAWLIDDVFTGYSHQQVELDLVGDGTMFRQGNSHIDQYNMVDDVDRRPLPDFGFFEDCLQAPDWRIRFDCVRQAAVCGPIETCLAGYEFSPEPED
jgi:hypothetical protein